jgi:ABC-type lipoprotein export system ATPase subunit
VAPLLEISDLHTEIRLKQAVVRAVDGVTIHVEAGETLGIVGESGCGKTMTALSVMNLLPTGGSVVSGSIKLNGQEISNLPDEKMRQIRGNEIGMIFQDPLTSLNPTMTVGKQIAEAVRLHRGASSQQALERATEVLDLVGLPRAKERVSEYPHQFSGGMRQRVMIAMALACEPKLLGHPGHPRPRRHRRPGRPGRGAVRGQGRRDHGHTEPFRQPAAPLHRGPVPGPAGQGRGNEGTAVLDPRAAAGPGAPPGRLPVRAALPVRDRPLPRRGPAAERRN